MFYVFNYGFSNNTEEFDVILGVLRNSEDNKIVIEQYGTTSEIDIQALGESDIGPDYNKDSESRFETSKIFNTLISAKENDYIIGFDKGYIDYLLVRYPKFRYKAKFLSFKELISNLNPKINSSKVDVALQLYPEANKNYQSEFLALNTPRRKIECDTSKMYSVIQALLQEFSIEELYKISTNHDPNILGFGKYKGYKISEVCELDLPYIKWLIESIRLNIGSSKDPERDKALIETIKQNLTKIYSEADHE